MVFTINHKLKSSKLKYILVFLALAISTNPFFTTSRWSPFFLFILLGFLTFQRKFKLDSKIILLVIIVVLLIAVQGIIWGIKLLTVFTYVSFIILTPYFLYRLIGIEVFKYLVNIVYFFSITSLVLWFFQNVSSDFDSILQNLKQDVFKYSFDRWPRSIIVYTVSISKADLSVIDIYRNSGIFHEPGGFANWLILTIGLNTIFTGKPFHKKNILFTITLLTTFSTAGYIQLFILWTYFVIRNRIYFFIKLIIILVFIDISVTLFRSAEFLHPKIERHIETQFNRELENTFTTGRIIRAAKVINVIKQSPIVGRGIITASAEENKYSAYYISGTSSIKIFAHFGLVFGFIFFLIYYRGILYIIKYSKYDKYFAFFFLSALFLGGLSQDFFYDSISIQFLFIGMYEYKRNFFTHSKISDVFKTQRIKLK